MTDILSSLRRTPYQTFAALSVLFFTLLLSGILFISVTFLQGLLNYVETRPRVIVYFQVGATDEQIKSVKQKTENTNKASKVTYISKSKAFAIYKEFTKNDPLLLEMTSADILPASLEIDALKPEYLEDLSNLLKEQPGVDEVQYQKDIIDNLLGLTSKVRKTTMIFFGYLMFMSIIVLTTTLSFKIALKRDEIGILKLIGASNMYIRKPFIGESLMLGTISALLSNVVLILMMLSANSLLSGYFAGMPNLVVPVLGIPMQIWPFNFVFIIVTLAITSLFSLGITLVSSFVATNRYL